MKYISVIKGPYGKGICIGADKGPNRVVVGACGGGVMRELDRWKLDDFNIEQIREILDELENFFNKEKK